ncbi:MAG: hypothetical protein AAGF66_04010 [Cyanobacteria bacterium P01_H01_bin.119]
MKTPSNLSSNQTYKPWNASWNTAPLEPEISEARSQEPAPLSLFRRAEVWLGRFAMVGFMATAALVALQATA